MSWVWLQAPPARVNTQTLLTARAGPARPATSGPPEVPTSPGELAITVSPEIATEKPRCAPDVLADAWSLAVWLQTPPERENT